MDLMELDRCIQDLKALNETNDFFDIAVFVKIEYATYKENIGFNYKNEWSIEIYINGKEIKATYCSIDEIIENLEDGLEKCKDYLNDFFKEIDTEYSEQLEFGEKEKFLKEVINYYKRI
ncbi:hypothetical protein [Fusobacterium massiliense]|uniref:hypothetical protein n=1 Tax=Fusobacterium massiliense TaxID=1852365 RepID=UPI0028D79BE2|nr:hypothetical protein [Fusobacterium massiliense]